MATELETKLNRILQEKTEKIIPENIKKGVQIFNIEGTYEGAGGPTVEGVKQFSTIEEMYLDSTAQDGDVAIVYREDIQECTMNSTLQLITFPKTIVLDETIVSSYNCYFADSSNNRIMLRLNPSMFSVLDYNTYSTIVSYSSTDGINYTRDLELETYDLEVEYKYYSGTWNDAIGKFVLVGSTTFDGIFKYQEYTNLGKIYNFDWANAPTTASGSSPYLNNSSVILDTSIFAELDELLNFKTKGFLKFFTIYDGSYYYCIPCNAYRSYSPYMYYDYTNNKMYVTMDTARCQTNVGLEDPVIMYKVNKTTKEITNIDMMTLTSNVIFTFNNGADKMCLICEMPFNNECFVADYYIVPQNENNSLIQNVSAMYTGNGIGVNKDYMNQTMSTTNVDEFGYILMNTQLNATAEYVYEKEFYGKDGVEIGTLGNPNNSFADVNAELFYKIQNAYDNMEPRVLTDSDKTIDKSIYIIPTKSDGTSLVDTSNLTNAQSLFSNCSSLAKIPLLNTSKVTNASNMFYGCSSLKEIPLINTSKVTTMHYMFASCKSLTKIPLIDTSSVTNMNCAIYDCPSLVDMPLLDTSKVTNMTSMFYNCQSLVELPLLDTSKVSTMWKAFQQCTSLSDNSLNNILAMCKNAIAYTKTKTLEYLGLTEEQATRCTTLSNYAAFTAAGWTTGY